MELEFLQESVADVLRVDRREVTMDTTFAEDLGADSLDLFQIVTKIEEKFDIVITEEDMKNVFTCGELVSLVKQKRNR